MTFEQNDLLAHDAMVNELLKPLADFLIIPHATEIVVNRPGEVFVEAGPNWTRYEAPSLTLERCWSLANAIASYTSQCVDAHAPILSAQLPGGQRIQIVVPPATERDTISMTIRIPHSATRSFRDYQSEGFFNRFVWSRADSLKTRSGELTPIQQSLVGQLEDNRLANFLTAAVQSRQNIVFVGDTGCGKTSLMKSACQYIPEDERLITIEDVREIYLDRHPNRIHLLYSKGGQRGTAVTPTELIASAMRMKPDRVLLAELRGAEAFDFLKLLTTGHSGSISSFHAESCALAKERYVFMCKEHPHATIYDVDALKHLVALTIDVIVHIAVKRRDRGARAAPRKDRFISEVYYDPIAKHDARFGAGSLHRAGGLQ
jgi:type IV secretion system protein VirB11